MATIVPISDGVAVESWTVKRSLVLSVALFLLAAACGGDDDAAPANSDTPPPSTSDGTSTTPSTEQPPEPVGELTFADGTAIPPAPEVPTGPLDLAVINDLDTVFGSLTTEVDVAALARLGDSGDARIAWLMADLLRFFQRGEVSETAVAVFEQLTGTVIPEGFAWGLVTDHLIAWDLPAPPGYVGWKRIPFQVIEPAWEPFFGDPDSEIDYRLLSWGGVLIDDRPIDEALFGCPDGCIPALNDPEVTDAAGGDWYSDERIVFGVVINGEARAYPKHIMEVHEMVNDTLGGREIGMPYCTLCGSAQAYFTDVVPDGFEVLELRTSGLLTRSNKVMFDLHTFSVFDTFLGKALTGPLRDAGFTAEMVTVVTSTWGDWKAAHPDTTIVAQDGGIGRFYQLDPLGGRDDDGPIFPIGGVDPRLPVQAQVVGVVTDDGQAVAFPVEQSLLAIANGTDVVLEGIRVVPDGGGLRAERLDGTEIVSHQSFWFAWSQFQPDSLVWTPLS